MQGIPKESWDALLRPEESPFLEHDWLRAMEESKCATIDTGDSSGGLAGVVLCAVNVRPMGKQGEHPPSVQQLDHTSKYRGRKNIWSVGVDLRARTASRVGLIVLIVLCPRLVVVVSFCVRTIDFASVF